MLQESLSFLPEGLPRAFKLELVVFSIRAVRRCPWRSKLQPKANCKRYRGIRHPRDLELKQGIQEIHFVTDIARTCVVVDPAPQFNRLPGQHTRVGRAPGSPWCCYSDTGEKPVRIIVVEMFVRELISFDTEPKSVGSHGD